MTEDDIETMRILFNAQINKLCNYCRFTAAMEMEGIRDRLIQVLKSHIDTSDGNIEGGKQ